MSLLDIPAPRLVDAGTPDAPADPDGRTDALARLLADAAELADGDVIGLRLDNISESVAALRACWRLNLTPLCVHHRLGETPRRELFQRVGAQYYLDVAAGPAGGSDTCLHEVPRSNVSPDDRAREPGADGQPPALLLATSGSTGQPKIVRHTHTGLGTKAATMVAAHGLTSDDVILMPAPLAHISGMLNGILLPGAAGMTTVLMDHWDPGFALRLIREHEVTFMIGPPTFFVDLQAAKGFSREAVESIRLISCGGSTVTPTFVHETALAFDAMVKRTYGSTEAPTVTTWHVGDPPGLSATTDGRPTANVELRLDAKGALEVRGPEVCDGYTQSSVTRDAFTADGWFRTGDLARISEDGWLTIIGRVGSTIIRGGENISPAQVEAICDALPGVRASVVVGIPDERLGERVGLVVEADAPPSVTSVQDACEIAGLARFSWPEEIAAVDVFPRLAAGKPDRAALAALFSEQSGAPQG